MKSSILSALLLINILASAASASGESIPYNLYVYDATVLVETVFTIPDDSGVNICSSFDGTLNVYNKLYELPMGQEIFLGDLGTSGDCVYGPHWGLKGGSYVIKSTTEGHGNFAIQIDYSTATGAQDPEPNDSASQAQPLPLNEGVTGRLGYMGGGGGTFRDVADWWKFTLPVDGTFSTPVIYGAKAQLYDSDAVTELHGTIKDGSEFFGLKAGSYLIRVDSFAVPNFVNVAIPFGSYLLSNTFTPATGVQDPEPNDTAGQAQSLPLNGNVTGRWGYQGGGGGTSNDTNDWWTFTLQEDGVFSTPIPSGFMIRLYDSDAVTELEVSIVKDGHLTFGLKAGTYFIKVYSFSSPFGSYSLSNTFTPATGAQDPEPNDAAGQAQPLPLNGNVAGRWGYRGGGGGTSNDTIDWWTFTLQEDGAFSTPIPYRFTVHLYASDAVTELQPDIVKDGYLTFELKAGTYFIKPDSFSDPFGSYTLSNSLFYDLPPDVTMKYGDCDLDGGVSIAEVQTAINMYLGMKQVAACVDVDGNNSVSIDEVQKAINGFLGL